MAVPAVEHGMTVLKHDSDFEIATEVGARRTDGSCTRDRVGQYLLAVHQLVSEGRHATYAHGFGAHGIASLADDRGAVDRESRGWCSPVLVGPALRHRPDNGSQ